MEQLPLVPCASKTTVSSGPIGVGLRPPAPFVASAVLVHVASILGGAPYGDEILDFARRYPMRGYGGRFKAWIHSTDPQPYHSYGNGSAMRVSAVGLAFDGSGFGMGTRSQRYAMIVEDGTVTAISVEDGPGVEVSAAEAMMEQL